MTLNQNSSAVIANSYTYDNMSRIATVSDGTNTATYSRIPGTNLLSSTTITAGGSTKLTTTRNYDSLYRLTGISSTSGVITKAYSYSYDTKDRRTQLNMPDGTSWSYTYDEQGQLKSGIKCDATGKAIPGQSFGYDYDGIGNLTAEQRNIAAMNITYNANNVNQYTSRTIPGVAPVVGEAEPTAAIKAIRTDVRDPGYTDTMIIPARDGKYFSGMFRNIANTNSAVNVTYDVYATKSDNANNQQLINKQSGSFLVSKRDQNFAYDNDGNTTGDGVWTYTWNGENRLVKAEKADKKLEFSYDYKGRMIYRKAYTGNWTLTNTDKYVWDGFNQIAVYNGSDTLQKSMLWGEDLNGGFQSAGGVGGLLAVNDASGNCYPCCDGNGNARAYVDGTGAVVAEYEYSPQPELISRTGPKADELAALASFSTKPYDKDLDAFLYQLRILKGRWLSRDPMEEEGGVNLYSMARNNPIGNVDYLGMKDVTITLLRGEKIYEQWFDDHIQYLIRTITSVTKKGETICSRQAPLASPTVNRESVEIGYAFLLAHGHLFIQARSTSKVGNAEHKKFADQQITTDTDRIKTYKTANDEVEKRKKSGTFEFQGGLFLKIYLPTTSGFTNLADLVGGEGDVSTDYDKDIPYYGCYAGVIPEGTKSKGITIKPGHNRQESVTFATIEQTIKADITALFNRLKP